MNRFKILSILLVVTALLIAQTPVRVVDSTGRQLVNKSSSVVAPAQVSQSTTAAQILAANTERKQLIIQNTGTTIIKIVFGTGTPTQTVYHVALKAGTAADDGTGGSVVTDMWTGAVQAISSASGGTLVITEIQ